MFANYFERLLNDLIVHFLFRFIVKDRVTSFSSAQRSLIVMQILLRAKFDETDKVNHHFAIQFNLTQLRISIKNLV